jgi:hypothetical protein
MSRKYTKTSEYWDSLSKKNVPLESRLPSQNQELADPKFLGEPFYNYSKASRTSGGGSTKYRQNRVAKEVRANKYNNIRDGLLPFEKTIDGYDIRDAIELTQKAYANVSIFKNAIDIMSEFSNAEVYLEGGSKKSRDLISKWMKKVKMWKVKDQYFREFYRSGNIFIAKIVGKFMEQDFQEITKSSESRRNSTKNQIPVTYILLNPFEITSSPASGFNTRMYSKMLSEYDLERLKNPKTDSDRKIFESFPPEVKKKIKSGSWAKDGLKIQLDPSSLIYSFYKKQDYEPFAIPFGFAVLEDINFKIEMKKIDQSICRTIENVILLITMGNEPDKHGINAKNLQVMQGLMQNESVGRVLVADYTTKADFIIPDINKVLGSEKYKVINEDIREGLQNILIGSEKFANTTVKATVFFERLKESRSQFLQDFLQPEIDQICKNLGFRDRPTAKFEEVSLKDETQFNRVVTRMMELGILPPEEGIKVIETGIYPTAEELNKAQEKFLEQRKKGYYNPMVGGNPLLTEDVKEMKKMDAAQKAKLGGPSAGGAPKKLPQMTGRPPGATASYSLAHIRKVLDKTSKLSEILFAGYKKQFKKKKLEKQQTELVFSMIDTIIAAKDESEWENSAREVLKDVSYLTSLNVKPDILEVASAHNLDVYSASLLYHSQKLPE